ncbi:LysM peptidoglycan-binding domain-containing protein [Sporosarcina aquimarina]|uniref:LysM peptidoglycan-binding domain-containing protein n=1 Tax=Sporosarcina aquimarina TaxID=114975 RepID=A0ABU4FWL8_9BACL|nr:LysM peptidoglycan-binding domain-containing protein [Sporosarcina aquimarina]MDW0109101.1 LysM peptidoglycan-binding domain-containing protein [Sporosarcina aquimarina]
MTKSDYNSELEENRKEIELEENNSDGLPSRVKLRQNKKTDPKREKKESKKGLTLINIILVLFTLIPIGIFVYVLSDLYNPKEDGTVSVEKAGVTIEVGSGQTPNSSTGIAGDSDEEKDDTKAEDDKNNQDSKEDVKTEAQKSEAKPEAKPDSKPEVKPEVKPDPKPEVKPDPKPEVKPEPKPEVKPDPKPETKPEEKPAAKKHTVGPNETLYRISVNYYGSGAGVDKIKAANGLSSNSISVGQTLVIP